MFLVREALPSDLADIRRLAEIFDTVNLPNDPKVLARVVAKSRASFSGRTKNPLDREYLFVCEDLEQRRVVGTSMVIAQHGTREAPHLYYDVLTDERYSGTLGRHFHHRVLRLGANYHGPTEVGGLILLPEYRRYPEQLGKQLSYVRFLFMAMHPNRFRPRVLSELLPPLEPDGRSLLWEHLGKKFTNLTYLEADRISKENKEFIRTLFPTSEIFVSLFPKRVQRVIGRVGPQSKGVQKMLTRIGFQYSNRIDPFDGGPHYETDFSSIKLIRESRAAALRVSDVEHGHIGLVGLESTGKVHFRAIRTPFSIRHGEVIVPEAMAHLLGARAGSAVWAMPFPGAPYARLARSTRVGAGANT
jgi:arginine N-succinyltransferase